MLVSLVIMPVLYSLARRGDSGAEPIPG
jgi:hypothetical protein